MKKTAFFLALSLILALLLNGCGKKPATAGQNTPASSATASTSATPGKSPAGSGAPASPSASGTKRATPAPTLPGNSAFAELNANKLTFDSATERFFAGNTNVALDTMKPLLVTAVEADNSQKLDLFSATDLQKQSKFAWTMVWRLLNANLGKDKNLKDNAGVLTLSTATMKGYFTTAFAGFNGTIPDVPADLINLIKYDPGTATYSVMEADGAGYIYVLKSLTLSKASSASDSTGSATLVISMISDLDSKVVNTVSVEIVANKYSTYKYSVQSVTLVS